VTPPAGEVGVEITPVAAAREDRGERSQPAASAHRDLSVPVR
jgi:hypothetical protein